MRMEIFKNRKELEKQNCLNSLEAIPTKKISASGLKPVEIELDKKSFWWKHENLHRKAIMDYKACKPEIRERFDELEKKIFNQSSNLRTAPNKEKIEFTQYCWDEAEKLTDILINNINKKTISLKPGPFADMWDVFNKEAGFQIANQ